MLPASSGCKDDPLLWVKRGQTELRLGNASTQGFRNPADHTYPSRIVLVLSPGSNDLDNPLISLSLISELYYHYNITYIILFHGAVDDKTTGRGCDSGPSLYGSAPIAAR